MRPQASIRTGRRPGYDEKIQNRTFEVGDQVLLYETHLALFPRKPRSRLEGPHTLIEARPYGTYFVLTNKGKEMLVTGIFSRNTSQKSLCRKK